MVLVGWGWVIITVAILSVIVIVIVRKRSSSKKLVESVILSIIRSRNGATLDDIIVGAHISSDEAAKYVQALIAKNVIKVQEKDGKTIYMSA